VDWVLQGLRGYWTGYHQGFYADKSFALPPNCLAETDKARVLYVIDWLYEGQFTDIMSFFESLVNLFYDNYTYCGFA